MSNEGQTLADLNGYIIWYNIQLYHHVKVFYRENCMGKKPSKSSRSYNEYQHKSINVWGDIVE